VNQPLDQHRCVQTSDFQVKPMCECDQSDTELVRIIDVHVMCGTCDVQTKQPTLNRDLP